MTLVSAGDLSRVVRRPLAMDFAKSRTLQSAAQDADINVIVNRFLKTGLVPQVQMPPTHQDFEDTFDFQSSMNALVAARNSFMELPAAIRKRFGNDPAVFVEFVSKAENLEEMRKLGLAKPAAAPVPETVSKVRMVDKDGNDLLLRSDKLDEVRKLLAEMK